MLIRIYKRLVILAFIILSSQHISAQISIGTTGLLNMPSAEMQEDKTVQIGAGFLNKGLTPPNWNYGTYNYFGSFTLFPWFEFNVSFTLFKARALGLNKGGYTNQDRSFGFRVRPVKEGQFWKYMPALVLGTCDPVTETADGLNPTSGMSNGYMQRYYAAATKHFQIGSETIGAHVAYIYNKRANFKFNGLAFGVDYHPSFHPQLGFITEYDSRDVFVGATYLLQNHLYMQVEMQRMTRFSGGLAYRIHLK